MIRNLAQGIQAFTSNVFLVEGETTALVDAGAGFDIVSKVRDHTDHLDTIYLTHTHPDHVGNVTESQGDSVGPQDATRPANVDALRDAFDVETWGYDAGNLAVDNRLEDGERIQIGDDVYEVIHTPGHKDDHLCFFSRGSGVCFAGDLIFANGGFGRTDLPEGDREILIESIDRLREATGEDVTEIHTGHGPSIVTRPQDDIELAARAARVNR